MTETATKQISPQTSRRLVTLQKQRARFLVQYDELKNKVKMKKDELDLITIQTFALIRDEDPDGTLYATGTGDVT